MAKRITDSAKRYIVSQRKKGVPASKIAKDIDVSPRHVRKLWNRFQKTGTMDTRMGRPHIPITVAQMRLVNQAHDDDHAGVVSTAKRLKLNYDISYHAVYRIMKKGGMTEASLARSKRRKWVRFERKYANAMWHVDWHVMKDPRFEGLNLVTYLDDASRCVTGAALFEHATSENAVITLRLAIDRFGSPASVLSDNGSCFVGQNGRKKKGGTWKPTLFEEELLARDIFLINSRPYHPQTNGKLERFYRTLEEQIGHYDSLREYIDYYNEKRLHFSLDIDRGETPLLAFRNKKSTEAIRKSDPKWMERDAND